MYLKNSTRMSLEVIASFSIIVFENTSFLTLSDFMLFCFLTSIYEQ